MSYSDPEKAKLVVWFIEEGRSHVQLQQRVRRETGNRHAQVPKLEHVKRVA